MLFYHTSQHQSHILREQSFKNPHPILCVVTNVRNKKHKLTLQNAATSKSSDFPTFLPLTDRSVSLKKHPPEVLHTSANPSLCHGQCHNSNARWLNPPRKGEPIEPGVWSLSRTGKNPPWNQQVGRWTFPFWGKRPIFRGEVLVSGRVSPFQIRIPNFGY